MASRVLRSWAGHSAATVVAVGSVSLALVACGGDEEPERPSDERAAPPTETAPAEDGDGAQQAEAGERIFAEQGCGSCHTLEAAGTDGTIGPNLDEALSGEDREVIRTSIVDPDATVAEGFPSGVMPGNFGDRMSEAELDQLVEFLFQSAARE